MALLKIEGIAVKYGPVDAVRDVTMEIDEGETITVIGANGAGKTTTLNTISAILRVAAGAIWFDGHRIDRCRPDEIVGQGILHVPEGRRVFGGLSVEENLMVGASRWYRFGQGRARARELDKIFGLFPKLRERRRQMAWSLSGGEQQMLALGRALMARPRVLLLDEPSLGLAPIIRADVFSIITGLKELGLTILLVEQDAFGALRIADRAYVLELGRTVLQGPGQALLADPRVKAAYLGG
ncbi:Branched-chain amino acid transport system ATP-binding protein OS=Castellaniella defragrans OX=75697 GN=HNR28_003052 PE=3 SV=1 [Castellaniella defragrans]